MLPANTDCNLLFGILALQMDLISRDALICGMHAWVLDKAKTLGQILRAQGALGEDEHALLKALVQKHLQKHDNDPEKSLAALSTISPVCEELKRITDPDLQLSLAHILVPGYDQFPTRTSAGGSAIPSASARSGPVGGSPGGNLRFQARGPLSEGGLGILFVAEDQELRRDVALKEIQQKHAHDPESRARFLLEAEITGRLEHPGVVPVYGLGTYADGRPFYAMRLIKGNNLQEAIRRFHQEPGVGETADQSRLTLRQLVGRFVDVCNAVAYAHSRGVLHRDLKPGNVMLGKYGETLVVDWGLAKLVGRKEAARVVGEATIRPPSGNSTPTQGAMGTPAYMSPEQAAGLIDCLGPASDVYSLGATLYALLTGVAPFTGQDLNAILDKVTKGEFVRPRLKKAEIPAALEAVCLKAMALRPEDRYSTALDLAADVEHWLADEPVTAWREPWTARAARWARRHRPLVAAAGGLLVAAVVALSVSTLLIGREQRRAEDARVQAEEERERAEKNYLLAQEQQQQAAKANEMASSAVDLLTEAGVEWLDDKPYLERYQKKLLEKALQFYEEWAKADSQKLEDRRKTAQAYRWVGYVRRALGDDAGAEQAYLKAIEVLRKLMADFQCAGPYQHDLAVVHNQLGELLRTTGRPAQEADKRYQQALKLEKELTQDDTGPPAFRAELARILNNWGILIQKNPDLLQLADGPRPTAAACYLEAVQILERLRDSSPEEPSYRADLARTFINQGTLLELNRAHRLDAKTIFEQAVQILSDLESHPSEHYLYRIREYRYRLGIAQNNLGNLLKGEGRYTEAGTNHEKARDLFSELVRTFPGIPPYRNELANSLDGLGNVRGNTGRFREAEEAYRKALDQFRTLAGDHPNVPEYEVRLSTVLNNLAYLFIDQDRARGILLAVPHADPAATPLDATWLYCARIRLAEGTALLEEAIAHQEHLLKRNPQSPFHRQRLATRHRNLAETWVRLARHKETAAAARNLVRVSPDADGDAYNAAKFLARCVRLAEADDTLPEPRRRELSREYADESIALLEGLATKKKLPPDLARNVDVEALHGHEKFLRLLHGPGAGQEKLP